MRHTDAVYVIGTAGREWVLMRSDYRSGALINALETVLV